MTKHICGSENRASAVLHIEDQTHLSRKPFILLSKRSCIFFVSFRRYVRGKERLTASEIIKTVRCYSSGPLTSLPTSHEKQMQQENLLPFTSLCFLSAQATPFPISQFSEIKVEKELISLNMDCSIGFYLCTVQKLFQVLYISIFTTQGIQ